ncbi:MAG: glutaredoxin family protein, partial [Chloroflexi bacterium]|nr:glutaredoxin family protein [Chloroflexota bacterium]
MTENPENIVIYGAMWCGDCIRAKQFLDAYQVPYQWVSIEDNPEAIEYV